MTIKKKDALTLEIIIEIVNPAALKYKMEKKKRGIMNLANLITGLRIICSIILLFCTALSPVFYGLYIAAGITDMIDGTAARKTDSASELGARLDTVADFVFVAVCLIKLLPVLNINTWICVWVAVIAVIKIINIVSGYVMRKKLVAVHSVMNKITGVLLFILPLTLNFIALKYSAPVVCMAATFAAIQEGHYIRMGKTGESN